MKLRIRPENTMDTVEHSLMRIFRDGPEVSLKGSPTVSPTTAALWHFGALAAVVAALNILLGVVPGTAGVGHEHRHGKAGDGHAAQQAHHAGGAQHQASSQRHDDGQQGRHHHLMQGTLGAQGHAGGVVRVCLVLHDARDLLELAADLHHDGLGRLLHRAHGEGGEDEGQHGADEHAHQHRGAGQGEVQHLLRVLLDDVHVADQQGQGRQGRRSRWRSPCRWRRWCCPESPGRRSAPGRSPAGRSSPQCHRRYLPRGRRRP